VSEEPMIAVVDDDESFRIALVESLRSLSYGVCDFASAEEFLGAGDNSCDCVITDIHMPGMSGIDLARQIMTRERRVPVIMVTARTEPGLEAVAAASGVICLLRKPFDSDALTSCLGKVFDGRTGGSGGAAS